MENNKSIVIEQVGNGFIVKPAPEYSKESFFLKDDILVFQTMSELTGFLEGHFSHRKQHVEGDAR